ncbi:hypothetical protein OFEAOIEE_LOCUS602 [Methylorubrum extorquens]
MIALRVTDGVECRAQDDDLPKTYGSVVIILRDIAIYRLATRCRTAANASITVPNYKTLKAEIWVYFCCQILSSVLPENAGPKTFSSSACANDNHGVGCKGGSVLTWSKYLANLRLLLTACIMVRS